MNFQGLTENLPLIIEFIKNNGWFIGSISVGAGIPMYLFGNFVSRFFHKRKITITIDPPDDK